ncbi:DNA cytosine methyltransferase [Pseudomonas fildesensis]|uniref:hypothetical protein n=1 Tax=Pseudomonas fildesensis TaxID=1674920 RepID=UPI0006611085|nr:hypothetical protein [Pseudomonas fildesensis]
MTSFNSHPIAEAVKTKFGLDFVGEICVDLFAGGRDSTMGKEMATVTIKGTPYVIADINMRMLMPDEPYRAQGFPDNYVIDYGHDGRKFSNKTQVLMVGNPVSPWPMMALVNANTDQTEDDLMEVAA